jgi:hypothetical protein
MLMFMLLQLNLAAINITGDVTSSPYSIDFQYQRMLQREYDLTQKRNRIESDLDYLGKQIDTLQRRRDEQLHLLGDTYSQLKEIRCNRH